jgi:hypothetical protein
VKSIQREKKMEVNKVTIQKKRKHKIKVSATTRDKVNNEYSLEFYHNLEACIPTQKKNADYQLSKPA